MFNKTTSMKYVLACSVSLAFACGGEDRGPGRGPGGTTGEPGSCTPDCTSRACGDDGCGGTCGSCSAGYECTASGVCDLNPSAQWIITVTNGSMETTGADGDWDFGGGAPDPFVCLTLNGSRRCTAAPADTFNPTWNTDFPATTAGLLRAGIMVEILDEDATTHDPVCVAGTVAFESQWFIDRTGQIGCRHGRFSYTLRPQ